LSISAITSVVSSATLPYLALHWGSTAVFASMFLAGLGEVGFLLVFEVYCAGVVEMILLWYRIFSKISPWAYFFNLSLEWSYFFQPKNFEYQTNLGRQNLL
jgi:hypothetical protein